MAQGGLLQTSRIKKIFRYAVPGLLLVLALLLHATGRVPLPFLARLELWTYDLRLNFSLPGGIDERIVIIDIDEKSLAEEGRWPWSRDRLALLLDQLFDRYGVSVAGFDVVFAEPDQSSGLKLLERLRSGPLQGDAVFAQALTGLRGELDFDGRFARALQDRPVVLGYYFTNHRDAAHIRTSGALPAPDLSATDLGESAGSLVRMTGYGSNLSLLQEGAASAGHINPQTDFDGVCRRVPLLIEYQDGYYQALSLGIVRTLLWNPPLVPGLPQRAEGSYRHLEWLDFADARIPVDAEGCALVPFRGGQGSFRYLSATDVLHDRVDPAVLEGAIVLIGTTAPGLMDLRAVPVAAVYPGVEIHANMVAGLLDRTIWQRPAWVVGAEVVSLICITLLLVVVLPWLGAFGSLVLLLGTLGAVLGGAWYAWQQQLVQPLAANLTLIFGLFVWHTSYGFLIEARSRKRITGLFGQYVPPQLVDEMSRDPRAFNTAGESREMTVLFSDVRNFTSMSEDLDPKVLARLMNRYLTVLTRVIQRHRGTIDKYIGDAVMAFWGAPLHDPEHARNGVLAALEMQREMVNLRAEFKALGWPEMEIGVGLSSGVMSVGNMGSEFRMAYTVLGDTVNLGARLEGLTKQYGVGIIVGEATRDAVPEILFRELDRVRVKGKERPVTIFEPLGYAADMGPARLASIRTFEQMLVHYRAGEWPEAETLLAELDAACSTPLYHLYRERISYYRQNPADKAWDGVFQFQSK